MKKGTLGEDKQWWPFALSAPVIGIYGNHGERGIEKLGFITLDEQCQMALDTAVNPVEDDEEEEGVLEVDNLDEPVEEETASPEGEAEENRETAPEDGEKGENAEDEAEGEAVSGEGEEEESSTMTDNDAIVAPEEGERTAPTPAEDPKSESSGLSTMAIVLIGVGSLLAVALLVLAVVMMLKKKAKGETIPQATPARKQDLEAGAENPPAEARN